MSRIIRLWATYALAAVGVAGLVFLSACNITSSSAGGSGRVHVLITDSPSDDWQQVNVILKSVSIRNQADKSWTTVWTEPTDQLKAAKLNLVTFSGVSTYLGTATLDAGKYDRLKFVIYTGQGDITLVDADGNGVDPNNITIVDPEGKGELKVDISPALEVTDGTATVVEADFDLAHPLSIIVENGKVVINLQVRHKAVPRDLRDIQFARSLGKVTDFDATATPNTFTLQTLEGVDIKFVVNSDTKYIDVDANGAAGTFTGLTALKGSADKGALVASNLWNDGSLYANRVWYGTLTALPQFTPEGLVLRVGDNWLKVLNKNAEQTTSTRVGCHWDSDVIFVNDATTWFFHDGENPIATGTAMLKNIRRGFRVTVELDTSASFKLAKSINIQSAHDEGAIRSVSDTGFVFRGWGYCRGWRPDMSPYSAQYYSHEWLYSTVEGHKFSWWFFGLPSSASDVSADFVKTVNAAMTAHLRVFAWAELTWDAAANSGAGGWVAENIILAPEKLPGPTHITTAYADVDSDKGTMGVSTFDWDDETVPATMTIQLDKTGNLQTIVGSFLWNATTKILTFTVPVGTGQWPTLLTPSNTNLLGVRVWVRPEKNSDESFTWHAYTVIAFQFITN